MSRKSILNVLSLLFKPTEYHAFLQDIIGAEKKTHTLAAETTLSLDFSQHKFIEVLLGTANITANAVITGLKAGERVYLKIVQDDAAARTVTWGTNIITDVTVTASVDAVDMLTGVFDGTNIILGALAQDAS